MRIPKTPGRSSSPVKPPLSEMHPSKVHPTMAPPSSGLRLGFTDIKPSADRDDILPAVAQTTPSKIGGIAVPSSTSFNFRFARDGTNELSADAQRMMENLREKASKFKEQLTMEREAEKIVEEDNNRKIAKAKGKAGRYSAAHMAEFKKMDSIADHPSRFRAQPGRTTPLKPGVKRSQSKADLDEPETAQGKQPTPAPTSAKTRARLVDEPRSTAKRARQEVGDDVSSNRPVSRDGSTIPRPKSSGMGAGIPRSKSNLASLMTPTKSSLSRSTSVRTPGLTSILKSPSKPSGLPRSATTSSIPAPKPEAEKESEVVQSPPIAPKTPTSRLDRVKSILRGTKTSVMKAKTGLYSSSLLTSKTPGPTFADKDTALPVPMTTPGRKLTKRVAFTPETRRETLKQNSPSPVKLPAPELSRPKPRQVLGEVYYPPLDAVLLEEQIDRGLAYPDLASSSRPLPEPPVKQFKAGSAETSAPGTFTFRSDHTISFKSASPSFGSSPGQASVRQVRPSILTTETMPGSFPTPAPPTVVIAPASSSRRADNISRTSTPGTTGTNKENEAPRTVYLALPHGMSNKKRNRASTDEEEAEQEAAERAAKKRRQETVPEGDALLAPRLVGSSSISMSARKKRPIMNMSSPRKKILSPGFAGGAGADTPGTPSPVKKKGVISLSRLNMLARPKERN